MIEPNIRFKKDDDTNYPDLKHKLISDVMEERHELSILSDSLQQLSFTIEEGVINPEDKKTNKRDFLMKDKANKKFAVTEINDIIYNPANIKFGAIHRNKYGKGGVSPIYAIFKPLENPTYLEYYVRRKKFISKAMRYLEGSVEKLKSLKPNDFLKLDIYIPCDEEQEKISVFFSQLDEIIKECKNEQEKLNQLKKGMLQKIFSQKIRFKYSDGNNYEDWIKVKLKDIGVCIRGLSYDKTMVTENGTLVLRSNNIYNEGGFLDYYNDCQYVKKNPRDEQILKKGDVVICMANGSSNLVGKAAKYDGNYNGIITAGAFCSIFRSNEPIVEYLFQSPAYAEYRRLNLQGGDGAIANLKASDIEEFEFWIPKSLEEQNKIVEFLASIDENIVASSEELEQYKKLKKGLLQQMFI